jgi:hypothetical protein
MPRVAVIRCARPPQPARGRLYGSRTRLGRHGWGFCEARGSKPLAAFTRCATGMWAVCTGHRPTPAVQHPSLRPSWRVLRGKHPCGGVAYRTVRPALGTSRAALTPGCSDRPPITPRAMWQAVSCAPSAWRRDRHLVTCRKPYEWGHSTQMSYGCQAQIQRGHMQEKSGG